MKNKRGFTLIELLFVIAIITVVVTTTVVSYMAIGNKQKQNDYETMIANMKTAAEVYLTKNVVARQAINNQGHVSIEIEELVSEGLLTDYYTVDPITKESYVGFCIIGSQKSTDKINEFSNPIPCGSYLSMNTLNLPKKLVEEKGLDLLYNEITVINEQGKEIIAKGNNNIESKKNLIDIYSIDGKRNFTKNDLTEGSHIVIYRYDQKYFDRTVIVNDERICIIYLEKGQTTEINEKYLSIGQTMTLEDLDIENIKVNSCSQFNGWKYKNTNNILTNITCDNPNVEKGITLTADISLKDCGFTIAHYYENPNDNESKLVSEEIILPSEKEEISIDSLKKEETGLVLNNVLPNVTKIDRNTEEKTIKLSYRRQRFNLTLNKDANISSVSGGGEYKYQQNLSISATPKSGYSFDKWSENITIMPLENKTLTAISKANEYTLNITKGTNSTGINKIEVAGCKTVTAGVKYTCTYGATVKVSATAKSGYTINSALVGTNISNKENDKGFTMPVPTSGTAVTLKINATAITYTVSFNQNGGSGGQTSSVTATYNSTMPTITTTKPTKKYIVTYNYNGNGQTSPASANAALTFGGYYDTAAATGGTQYYTSTMASARVYNKTSNATLYARWSTTGTVTLPTPTARANYEFKGWCVNSTTCTTPITSSTYTASSAVTLYAQWEQNIVYYCVFYTPSPSNAWNINGVKYVGFGTANYESFQSACEEQLEYALGLYYDTCDYYSDNCPWNAGSAFNLSSDNQCTLRIRYGNGTYASGCKVSKCGYYDSFDTAEKKFITNCILRTGPDAGKMPDGTSCDG